MTTDINQEASARQVFEYGRAMLFISAGMSALVAYDICIFFVDELEFVWKSRCSIGKILYLVIRYGTFLLTIFSLFGCIFVDPSLTLCRKLSQVFAACACCIGCLVEATQFLRASALFGSSRGGRLIMLACGSVQFLAIFTLTVNVVLSYETIHYPFEGYLCSVSVAFPKYIYLALYTAVGIPDLMLCIACSIRVFRMWTDCDSKLAWTMLRDMLAYMIILAILAAPQFATPLFLPTDATILIAGLNFAIIPIGGIISCRLVLNMRSYVIGDPDVSLTTMSMALPTAATISQVRFDRDGEVVSQDESTGGA